MGDVGNDAEFVVAFFGEFDGGFNFGEHGTGFEIAIFDEIFNFFGRDLVKGLLVGKFVVGVDIGDGGD